MYSKVPIILISMKINWTRLNRNKLCIFLWWPSTWLEILIIVETWLSSFFLNLYFQSTIFSYHNKPIGSSRIWLKYVTWLINRTVGLHHTIVCSYCRFIYSSVSYSSTWDIIQFNMKENIDTCMNPTHNSSQSQSSLLDSVCPFY